MTPIHLDERIAILRRSDYERLVVAHDCIRGRVGYEEHMQAVEERREALAELRRIKEGGG